MESARVVITDRWDDDYRIEERILGEHVDEFILLDDVELRDAEVLRTADAILNWRKELPAEVIADLERCRIIARYGVGVDNVDVEAASSAGITVSNTPTYCVEEVATHAVTLMLALSRRITRFDRGMAGGDWKEHHDLPMRRFSTETVGLFGFGNIGQYVCESTTALGADVLVYDPYVEEGTIEEAGAEPVGFDALIERSDTVSVHAPLTTETRGTFASDVFGRMQPSARLVNVARGELVDEVDLLAALANGEIAGAALDVFDPEPPDPDHPIRTHPDVITTPHVAWYSVEANEERSEIAARNVLKALNDGTPPNPVNAVEGA